MHTPNIIHFLAQLHHHHLYPIQNQISQNVCFQLVWGVCVSVCVCVCVGLHPPGLHVLCLPSFKSRERVWSQQ